MAQTKPKAGQFYGVSDNGTDGQFLKTDGTGGMSWDSPITNPTITSIDILELKQQQIMLVVKVLLLTVHYLLQV